MRRRSASSTWPSAVAAATMARTKRRASSSLAERAVDLLAGAAGRLVRRPGHVAQPFARLPEHLPDGSEAGLPGLPEGLHRLLEEAALLLRPRGPGLRARADERILISCGVDH